MSLLKNATSIHQSNGGREDSIFRNLNSSHAWTSLLFFFVMIGKTVYQPYNHRAYVYLSIIFLYNKKNNIGFADTKDEESFVWLEKTPNREQGVGQGSLKRDRLRFLPEEPNFSIVLFRKSGANHVFFPILPPQMKKIY
jgi:hypothetical protein